MKGKELTVAMELQMDHQGRERAISMAALARQCGIGTRRLQTIIKALAEVHHLPIGRGTRDGYYWITDPAELDATAHNLFARGVSAIQASRAYRKIGDEQFHAELDEALGRTPLLEHRLRRGGALTPGASKAGDETNPTQARSQGGAL